MSLTECQCCCMDTLSHITCTCNYSCCTNCLKTYLLGTTKDPHCMNCQKAIERRVLCEKLGKSWVNGKYKKHTSKVLYDKEIAKLASSQPAANRQLAVRRKDQELKDLKERIYTLNLQYRRTQQEQYRLKEQTTVQKKQFLQKCGVDGCRGSLSTAWKCEMCQTYTCSKCHAVKGKDREEPHECNADNIASVVEISKTTRDCPGCSSPVFKIEGCDQMFCTVPGCETAFSFRTGMRETGQVHNPHFFEMQQQGLLSGRNGNVPRAPGDILCGGIPNVQLITTLCTYLGATRERKIGLARLRFFREEWAYALREKICRGSIHFDNVIIHPLRERIANAQDNEDLRVRFLLKEIDEKQFKSTITRREKKRQQDQATLHIMELFSAVLQDQLRHITRGEHLFELNGKISAVLRSLPKKELLQDIQNTIQEVGRVRDYCNDELQKIADEFKVTGDFISDNPCNMIRI